MAYIPREIESRLTKYLQVPHIIAILGPRRSGKTTLIQHLEAQLPNSCYLSFEDHKTLALFDNDIDSFIELYIKKHDYIFLDEFHYAREGGKRLKYIFDFYPGKKIFLSGSSALEITIKAAKQLVGRIISFSLFPFSFREFLLARQPDLIPLFEQREIPPESPLHKQLFTLWEEYLLFGGYPEVVLQSDWEVKIKLLEGIYNTYLLREVRDILGLIDEYKYTRLMTALALQIGNLVNFAELSQISGYEYRTLKQRLNVLEKTYIVSLLHPFYRNKRLEIVKNPKVFFFDTGLRNYVIDNFQRLELRTDKGSLCENYVWGVLHRIGIKHYFWRTKSKVELDFVIEKSGQLIPIEVKCNPYGSKLPRAFHSFHQKYTFGKGFLLNLSAERRTRKINSSTIEYLPIYALELRPEFSGTLTES
ncbi:MAG: ATP-binding protein [Calditrichaeota bacterium]|nr:MAG: ATP-binding protein [Calditrichota bacterium]